DVEKISSSKDVDKSYITLDKKFFGVYSSAQAEHHFKFKPTRKALIFAIALVFVVAFLARAGMLVFGDKTADAVSGDAPSAASSSGSLVSDMSRSLLGAMGGAAVQPGTGKTRGHYVEERLPRMPNIPSSAPIYDGLTAPVSFPRLYCVASRDLDLYARNQQ